MATKAGFITLADSMLNATFKDFNVPIEIFELVETPDNQGGIVATWNSFASVDAFIFPMTGIEKIQNGRLISDQLFKCHLKPITNINEKMKLVYNSEDYQIRSIENLVSANIWLKMTIEKGVVQ